MARSRGGIDPAVRFLRRDGRYVAETRRRGLDVYREPLLNKGSAFSLEERRALGLEGVLPGSPKTMDEQARRVYELLRTRERPIDQYLELRALQDRNEHLFFRVLRDHLAELMPIVYTPTVGEATRRFSELFRSGRGLWLTPEHRGRQREVLEAAVQRDVRLIVATDNESILGIGDQGAGGMAISVGKLSLYCAAAGLHPALTLPISLDVGTDNVALRDSPHYLGWARPRLRGAEYLAFLDEFVEAVRTLFPRALLQWEDLRNETALTALDRYRDALPSFNDDIEGTGATAVAGVVGASRLSRVPLREQRYVVFGAGAAGLGIARQLRALLVEEGLEPAAARTRVAALDSRGLLVEGGRFSSAYKAELALPGAAAASAGLAAGAGLEQVVERFAPHGLIGTSGVPGSFTRSVVERMAAQHAAPLILPLSNPTSLCEATPADVLAWSSGRAIVATGSPFPPVEYDGRPRHVGQGNNVFVFPGLGLGAIAASAQRVSPAMLRAASRAVAEALQPLELARGLIYPDISRLPEVAQAVARAVAAAAGAGTDLDVERALDELAWEPVYPDVVAID
jgi:malic enzyme